MIDILFVYYINLTTETYLFVTYHVVLTSAKQDRCTEVKSSQKLLKMKHVYCRIYVYNDCCWLYRLQIFRRQQ